MQQMTVAADCSNAKSSNETHVTAPGGLSAVNNPACELTADPSTDGESCAGHGDCPRPCGWDPVSPKTVTRRELPIGQGNCQFLILFQSTLLQCIHQISGHGQH